MRALAILFVLFTGCVQLEWGRKIKEEPLDAALVAALPLGADLEVCLLRLGAPLRVWDTGGGVAMAYGAINSRNLGLKVSVTVYDYVTASFSLDDERLKWKGAVLWFDEDLKLVRRKTGLLAEIAPRRRPSVEES